MAMTLSNVLHCPKPHLYRRNCLNGSSPSNSPFSRVRRALPPASSDRSLTKTKGSLLLIIQGWFPKRQSQNLSVVCTAATPAGSSNSDSDINPYEVLGASPIEGFDMIKAAYTRKRKEAERRGDEATVNQLERAYDKIMMAQLTNRKKGLTFGSFQVSKDIKYADKMPLIPWGPRFTKSSVQDMRINMGISAVIIAWIVMTKSAEWKPLQFLIFAFVYRIFEKLKASETQASPTFSEAGEDEGRGLRMGKRLLRSLALVFGCIAIASVGFTLVINVVEHFLQYIPVLLYNSQEMFITASTAVMLYIIASYYR